MIGMSPNAWAELITFSVFGLILLVVGLAILLGLSELKWLERKNRLHESLNRNARNN